MLSYLREWLQKRAGVAPVWVTFRGENQGTRFNMIEVDEIGVVLADVSAGNDGAAFPWSAVTSVKPDRER